MVHWMRNSFACRLGSVMCLKSLTNSHRVQVIPNHLPKWIVSDNNHFFYPEVSKSFGGKSFQANWSVWVTYLSTCHRSGTNSLRSQCRVLKWMSSAPKCHLLIIVEDCTQCCWSGVIPCRARKLGLTNYRLNHGWISKCGRRTWYSEKEIYCWLVRKRVVLWRSQGLKENKNESYLQHVVLKNWE